MPEIDLHGVFVSGLVAWAAVAYLIRAGLSRLFTYAGIYRLVWHRPLFDFAVFVILWGAVAWAAFRLAFPDAEFG